METAAIPRRNVDHTLNYFLRPGSLRAIVSSLDDIHSCENKLCSLVLLCFAQVIFVFTSMVEEGHFFKVMRVQTALQCKMQVSEFWRWTFQTLVPRVREIQKKRVTSTLVLQKGWGIHRRLHHRDAACSPKQHIWGRSTKFSVAQGYMYEKG